MTRGDDVAELQARLGRLGFDAGRVDGIFGPLTAVALADFQRNSGLHPDGICGFETLQALRRVSNRTGDTPVAAVREQEALRHASPRLADKRIVVGELEGPAQLCRAVTKTLRLAGAQVMPVDEPDGSVQAGAANGFGAHLYLGLSLADGPTMVAYYAVTGFESRGGRRLAELLHARLAALLPMADAHPRGLRLPVLRETRMPAVLCSLGPVADVAALTPRLAQRDGVGGRGLGGHAARLSRDGRPPPTGCASPGHGPKSALSTDSTAGCAQPRASRPASWPEREEVLKCWLHQEHQVDGARTGCMVRPG